MHNLMCGLLVAGGLVLASGTTVVLAADGLENGDFTKGKSRWMGDGQVVYQKPDGTFSPTDDSHSSSLLPPTGTLGTATTGTPAPGQKPGSAAVIELKLKSTQFADLFQKFRTTKEMDLINAEITYKTSADFKMNDKAIVFDREITWKPGSFWYWSALVHPKIDVLMRLDKRDNYMYKLEAATPGSDWKKFKVRWDNVGGGQDVAFHVLVTPGHG